MIYVVYRESQTSTNLQSILFSLHKACLLLLHCVCVCCVYMVGECVCVFVCACVVCMTFVCQYTHLYMS